MLKYKQRVNKQLVMKRNVYEMKHDVKNNVHEMKRNKCAMKNGRRPTSVDFRR